jgi:hypothetical protein
MQEVREDQSQKHCEDDEGQNFPSAFHDRLGHESHIRLRFSGAPTQLTDEALYSCSMPILTDAQQKPNKSK